MKLSQNKIKIRESTTSLILKYGVVSVSMDDIANMLGMSKKTLYISFKSKDELVSAVVQNLIQKNQDYCNLALIGSMNAVDELFKNLEFLNEIFRPLNPSILFDLKKYHADSFELIQKFKNEFVLEKIRLNLERGIAEGLFRENLNVDIVSKFRLESVFIPFTYDFSAQKYSLLEIEREILINYLYGLATEKGYKMIDKYLKQQCKN